MANVVFLMKETSVFSAVSLMAHSEEEGSEKDNGEEINTEVQEEAAE